MFWILNTSTSILSVLVLIHFFHNLQEIYHNSTNVAPKNCALNEWLFKKFEKFDFEKIFRHVKKWISNFVSWALGFFEKTSAVRIFVKISGVCTTEGEPWEVQRNFLHTHLLNLVKGKGSQGFHDIIMDEVSDLKMELRKKVCGVYFKKWANKKLVFLCFFFK